MDVKDFAIFRAAVGSIPHDGTEALRVDARTAPDGVENSLFDRRQ
jgi:hypothetical protein